MPTATAPFVHLNGAKLDGTVLDNLKARGAAQSFISDTLNATLKATLANAATTAKQSELAGLLKKSAWKSRFSQVRLKQPGSCRERIRRSDP
jgi:hypothetical protein